MKLIDYIGMWELIKEDYLEKAIKLRKRKKVVCEKCGNSKWYYIDSYTLTSFPGATVTNYSCSECGNKYSKHVAHENYYNEEIEIFEEMD